MHRWYPVARSEELVPRHVAQTQLLGQEIALWRSDAGLVNAWENRCPHRGVRLSIGLNTGTELRCRYHGWRFAAGSGRCTYIPAHPTQIPASTVCARVYASAESGHLVWVCLDPQTGAAAPAPGDDAAGTSLRSLFVEAPAGAVAAALLRGYRCDAGTEVAVTAADEFTLTAGGGAAPPLTFRLQPVTDTQTVIHAILRPAPTAAARLAVLRHHNEAMKAVRDAAERGATPAPQ